MIFTDKRVRASGPRAGVALAAIGMAPQKWEVAANTPFVGPSGKVFDEALAAFKTSRHKTFVTNLCEFFIDDNNLYSVPQEIMERERDRVFHEIESVRPNCLLVMGADTLDLLTARKLITKHTKKHGEQLATVGSRKGITKWRGSIFELETPRGHRQKCVAAMHPASFIRGQWKWLPIYKYVDVPRAVTQSSSPELKLTARSAITGPSFRQACDYLRSAMTQPWVSIDYEGRSSLTCLGVGWSASEALCIPMCRVGSSSYWSIEEELEIWRLWCELLQDQKVQKIAQNASYEWIKSWMHGVYPTPLGIDTMHLHHCLYPDFGGIKDEWTARKRDIDNPGHSLAFITSQYTDQPYYKDDGRHWTPELGEDRFWAYNALDVMVTFEAAMKMKTEAESVGLWETYCQQYRDLFEHTLRMEWYGTPIDLEARAQADAEVTEQIRAACAALSEQLKLEVITRAPKGAKPKDGVLNLASPPQLRKFLEARGHTIRMNRKTGRPTVDKDALQVMALYGNKKIGPSDPAVADIIHVNQLEDLLHKVIRVKLDAEGSIHCHMKLGGTNGTRISTAESILESGTNLQNIPRQGIGRNLFKPGPTGNT